MIIMQGFHHLLMLAQTADPDDAVPMPPWGRRAQEVFEGWQNTSDMFPVRNLVIILAVVMAIFAFVSLRQWWRNRPKEPGSSVLFRRISRRVGLGWLDQWFLIQIARACHLPSPLTLMVARGTFLHYAHMYANEVAPWRKPMVTARSSRILARLYGSASHAQQDIQAIIEEEFSQPVEPAKPADAAAAAATADGSHAATA